MSNDSKALGQRIKELRLLAGLTLRQLSVESLVSASHLGCIERRERLSSARILRKIAKPLGFDQSEPKQRTSIEYLNVCVKGLKEMLE